MIDPKAIVEQYLSAFYRGDVEAARGLLSQELSFSGPAASFSGVDAYLKTAGHASAAVSAVEPRRFFVDGSDVCVFYDLVLRQGAGRIPVAEWHHLEGGRIASIRMIFDTAPFTRRSEAPGESAVDPVCKMTVEKRTAAATRKHAGVTYYFCNAGCAAAFEEDPGSYLAE